MTKTALFGTCVIVRDPDPLGGFRPGAELTGVEAMLREGCFTPGTEVIHRGRRCRVWGTGKFQRLVRLR